MQNLISDELASSLHEQIGEEMQNANIYLYVAGFLENMGLRHLAKLFEDQHSEEIGHAKMIYKILTDLGTKVIIPEIGACEMAITKISDIALIYMNREKITTESLNEIKLLAIEDNNPVVEEAMREMIALQRKEYEEATDFSDKTELMGDDWFKVFHWDMMLE